MPRFSILTPARNEEKCLPGCLESIKAAAETFPDHVEVIVAVNRCSDRTKEIAVAHGAKVVHDDSRNLAKIRNAEAREATGEVIVTIDRRLYKPLPTSGRISVRRCLSRESDRLDAGVFPTSSGEIFPVM